MNDGLTRNVDAGEFEDEPAISKLMREGVLDEHLFEAGRHALGKDHAPRCAVALGRATAQRIVSDAEITGSGDDASFGAFAGHIRTWNQGACALDENGYRLAVHCLMAELVVAKPAWNWSLGQKAGGPILIPRLIKAIVTALCEDPSMPSHFNRSMAEFGGPQYSANARFELGAVNPDFDPDVVVRRARANFFRAQVEVAISDPAASKPTPRV